MEAIALKSAAYLTLKKRRRFLTNYCACSFSADFAEWIFQVANKSKKPIPARTLAGTQDQFSGWPASIGRPPNHAPTALPKLNATYPMAAAKSCPSLAFWRMRTCSGPEIKKTQPAAMTVRPMAIQVNCVLKNKRISEQQRTA